MCAFVCACSQPHQGSPAKCNCANDLATSRLPACEIARHHLSGPTSVSFGYYRSDTCERFDGRVMLDRMFLERSISSMVTIDGLSLNTVWYVTDPCQLETMGTGSRRQTRLMMPAQKYFARPTRSAPPSAPCGWRVSCINLRDWTSSWIVSIDRLA